MNRIIIKNNIIDSNNVKYIDVKDNVVTFKKSGDYVIEYIECDRISIEFNIIDNIDISLFIVSKDNDIVVDNHYILGKNSNLLLYQFYDNKRVIEKCMIDLNGEKAKVKEAFSCISHGDEEYHIIVNHNNDFVCSDISNKCVGLDGSKIFLKIDSKLDKGNIDCVMDQNSRILTLGDVDATIIPNMFIDEDSVEARHGSIIGGFSFDEIFYFMSRGISYDEAILLLIKGFLFSNMDIGIDKREYIMNSILDLRR